MKAIKCEMCGSNDLVKQEGLFVCQNCGTKYTVEEAKKLLIEGPIEVKGMVKIDDSIELSNLYELARRFKDSDSIENALKYYEMILVKDPNNWEANFYVLYYRVRCCKRLGTNEIQRTVNNLKSSFELVLDLVKKSLNNKEEIRNALSEISDKCVLIADTIAIRDGAALLYRLGDIIEDKFGEEYGSITENVWKNGVRIHGKLTGAGEQIEERKIMKLYTDKINKYDHTYSMPSFNMCYVATAVYGSYNCPQVWTLRRFRDNTLDETWYGRAFIKTYYAISPTLVKWFGETSWFKRLWRKPLDRLVATLNGKGIEDTPYQDKY